MDGEVFLLRVWAERRARVGDPAVYRARMEHVGTARVRYFTGLGELEGFVGRCLADSDLPPGRFEGELDVDDRR